MKKKRTMTHNRTYAKKKKQKTKKTEEASCVSQASTPPRREQRFRQKCAPRAGESTAVLQRNRVGWAPRLPKLCVFTSIRENAHRSQAKRRFSKCAPRAGEGSNLPTQDGAHRDLSKQNVRRAEARAPFSTKKKRAARWRERKQIHRVRRAE